MVSFQFNKVNYPMYVFIKILIQHDVFTLKNYKVLCCFSKCLTVKLHKINFILTLENEIGTAKDEIKS